MTRSSACLVRRRFSTLLLTALVLTGMSSMSWGDVTAPTAQDRHIAVTVAELLQKRHLSRHPFDQEIARRTITQFVKFLDPMKVYFYQSDVDGFMARQAEVENVAKRGDVGFAYAVFRTFLKRLDDRVKLADQLLAMPHDFSVDEEMVFDPDATQFPKDEAEAREKWRKRIKYDRLERKGDRLEKLRAPKKEAGPGKPEPPPAAVEKSPEEQAKEDVEKLRQRYQNIAKRWHQIDREELLEMYLSAVSMSYDPHTSYMSPGSMDNFEIQMRLKLEGIGAALKSEEGYTVVDRLIPRGPADKDGRLKVGDRIVGVGQNKTGPIQDVVEMKLSDVVKLIRGSKGTVVRLEVTPENSPERKTIEITRAEVELKDAGARSAIFEAGRKADGRTYRVGVIDLPSFYMDMAGARHGLPDFKSTTRDVREMLGTFNAKGVDAVVLDLRHNGGGSLQEAIDLTGLFIEQGPVVQVKGTDGRTHRYDDEKGGLLWKGPLVVVVDKYSASASEILAGAIQDYRRGLIVGDPSTHGKGTVQSLLDLGEELLQNPFAIKLGALKLTIQKFYRPNGESTQLRGVLSDIVLPSRTSHRDVGEADLEYPLEFDQVKPVAFKPFNLVAKPLVEELARLSKQRREASDDFQKLLKQIARDEDRKKNKRVTLNEQKFLAEWAELSAQRDEAREMAMAEGDPSKTEIKRDYYLNEVLAITADYLNLLPGIAAPQAAQAARAARDD